MCHSACLACLLCTRWISDAGLGKWLHDIGSPVVVLRPDRYVFGVVNKVSELAHLAALLPT